MIIIFKEEEGEKMYPHMLVHLVSECISVYLFKCSKLINLHFSGTEIKKA